MDTIGTSFRKRTAGFAFAARFHVRPGIETVYRLGEYPRRTCLADAPRAAEEIGMGQLAPDYGILESSGYIVLPDKRFERVGAIFSCGYYILRHNLRI